MARSRRAARAGVALIAVAALAASAAPAVASGPSERATTGGTSALPSEAELSPDELLDFTELTHGEEIEVKTPFDPDKYRYTAEASSWSGVAIDPGNANYNLALWADPQLTVQLAKSSKKVGVDFVVVDSNDDSAPVPTRYYPRVVRVSGTGEYRIELDSNSTLLEHEVQDSMSATDVISVMDTFLLAGETYRFTVSGSRPEQNPSIFLMQPLSHEGGWYQSSHDAVASANREPAGKDETFTFRSNYPIWYCLVLINKAGSGTYTITRSP